MANNNPNNHCAGIVFQELFYALYLIFPVRYKSRFTDEEIDAYTFN